MGCSRKYLCCLKTEKEDEEGGCELKNIDVVIVFLMMKMTKNKNVMVVFLHVVNKKVNNNKGCKEKCNFCHQSWGTKPGCFYNANHNLINCTGF